MPGFEEEEGQGLEEGDTPREEEEWKVEYMDHLHKVLVRWREDRRRSFHKGKERVSGQSLVKTWEGGRGHGSEEGGKRRPLLEEECLLDR